jgi:hypothetical protein
MTNPNLYTELQELGYIFVNDDIYPATFDEQESIDTYNKRIEMSNIIDWLRVEHNIIVQVTYEGHTLEGQPTFIADVYSYLQEGEEETTDDNAIGYYEAKLDGIEIAVELLKSRNK